MDALLATELSHRTVDCHSSHNRNNTVFLFASVHVEQHLKCTSHNLIFFGYKISYQRVIHWYANWCRTMKRDDTKKNFTALSGNDLKTVHLHYLSFPCFFAIVTISEVCGVMRCRSVINVLFRFFLLREPFFLFKTSHVCYYGFGTIIKEWLK